MKYTACYITTSGEKEAEKIADMLLEKRLIACANMFPIKSKYWWKGKIEKSNEFMLICKTKSDKSKKIIEEVKKIHSYDIPCINFIPIEKGNLDFLKWIDECMTP